MVEFSPMEVSLWVSKLNPNFKDALIPLGLSCAFHILQIRIDEPLLHAVIEFCIPTCHVFQFDGVELCPTTEEFGVIMDECNFGSIILPILEEDLSKLAHRVLGVHLSMAKRWCKSRKLNVAMVFKYFTKKVVPLVGAECSHHLSDFCLCILA